MAPASLGGAPRLAQPDLRDLLRGVLEGAAVAERRVAHHDLVSVLDETCQRAAAEDLEIVRVRADGEDTHQRASRDAEQVILDGQHGEPEPHRPRPAIGPWGSREGRAPSQLPEELRVTMVSAR